MRSITFTQFHAEQSERANDPNGGKLELYRFEDDNEYVGELPLCLVIPSADPTAPRPFLVHRLRDEEAVQELIDSLTAALHCAK